MRPANTETNTLIKSTYRFALMTTVGEVNEMVQGHRLSFSNLCLNKFSLDSLTDIDAYRKEITDYWFSSFGTRAEGFLIVFYTEHRFILRSSASVPSTVQRKIDKIVQLMDGKVVDVTEDYDIASHNRDEELKVLPALIYASYEASLDDATQCYPMVAEVTIQYEDDKTEQEMNIALLPMNELKGRVNDDEIFFYVDGIGGLAKLALPNNGEDFRVIQINGYTHYPEPEPELTPICDRVANLVKRMDIIIKEAQDTLVELAKKGVMFREDKLYRYFVFYDVSGYAHHFCGIGMEGEQYVLYTYDKAVSLDSVPITEYHKLIEHIDEMYKKKLVTC